MATQPLSTAELQAAVNARATFKTAEEAAEHLGIPRSTLNTRIKLAKRQGLAASKRGAAKPIEVIRRLERELKIAQAESADAQAVKAIIGETVDRAAKLTPPKWMQKIAKPSSPGVPTLMLSDLHWGEVVYPAQINGVNKYNLSIAHERLQAVFNSAFELLDIISPKNDYPGIVIPILGDCISGDIHEELAESNELHSIPTVLDLWSHLAAGIRLAADKYGNVFLPCVSGNHGRNTKKIRAKDRNHTSFDWMLYQLLAKEFANDKRVTFYIPDGSDAYYKIYGTRYLATHLDQFRGGDGMIGALGPIIRGDHKKRSRNGQIDMSYDVLIGGHWHQYIHLTRLIVNGSLKGYDEFAWTNNFGFERPQQALWITHPRHSITFRMPVYADRGNEYSLKTKWVSVPTFNGK